MPRSEQKKKKKKTPKKSEEEDPAMQEADFNQLLQNALEQLNAQHEEKLKELDKLCTIGESILRCKPHS